MDEIVTEPKFSDLGTSPKAATPQFKQMRVVRRLETLMTDSELRERGLATVSPPKSRIQSWALFGDDFNWTSDVSLLIPRPGYRTIMRERAEEALPKVEDWLERFAHRLVELTRIADEEDLPLSSASRKAVEGFVRALDSVTLPSVFLIGNGNFRLVWENEAGEQIGLQFLDQENVQFVFFQRSGEELDHIMGTKKASEIGNLIARLGLRHVMSD